MRSQKAAKLQDMKESKESKKAAAKVKSKVEKVYLQMSMNSSSSLFLQLPPSTKTSFTEVFDTLCAIRTAAQSSLTDGCKFEAPSKQVLDKMIANAHRLNNLVSALMNQCVARD